VSASAEYPKRNFGFAFTPEDPFIALDIDHLDSDPTFGTLQLPTEVDQLLRDHPTYSEVSPSGQGLHIIYKVNKDQFGEYKDQDKNLICDGSIFVRNQFVTFTGEAFTDHDVTTINETDLHSIRSSLTEVRSVVARATISAPTSSMEEVKLWLQQIPIKLTPRLKRAYSTLDGLTNTDEYEHWCNVGMALHFYGATAGKLIDCSDLFNAWSAKDPEKYDGTDSTYNKFITFAPTYDGTDITHATLQRLFHNLSVRWTKPIFVKGRPTNRPKLTEVANFLTLASAHDLKVRQNEITKTLTVSGDTDIIDRFFNRDSYEDPDTLRLDLLYYCQQNGFDGLSEMQTGTFARYWASSAEQFNPIQEWIESEPWDGTDRLKPLLDTILYADESNIPLYHTYLRKNLMSLLRSIYYTGDYGATTGIVVLQGPENTRKSTWLQQLLPLELKKDYIGESQCDLDSAKVKEMQLEAALFQIMIYDEVERLLSHKNDSKMKNFLTQEYDTYRPLFGKRPVKTKRRAVFFGTTNQMSLAVSSSGSRRVQVVPIAFCDTSSQREVDLQQLYAQLLVEFKAAADPTTLWTLTDQEVLSTNIENDDMVVDSDVDAAIKELFDFRSPFIFEDFCGSKGGFDAVGKRSFTTKAIASQLTIALGGPVKRAMLTHALQRLCGRWTDSINKKRVFQKTTKAERKPVSGGLKNGLYKTAKTQRWLLPPLASTDSTQESID
jgi:hypothetical protein